MEQMIVVFVVAFVILVVIFLIFREINCWYWKINERIGLQEETNKLMRQILSEIKETGNGAVGQTQKKSISGPVNPITPNPSSEETINWDQIT